MRKIVVFASGSGSNFENIVKKLHGRVCEVALLVCDKPGALCVERAEKLGIPSVTISPKDFNSKSGYEEEIIKKLSGEGIDLIVLAGYMRIIGPVLLDAFEGKIINIHPSLLPAFKGLDAIGQAFRHGVRIMGATVHFVDSGMDTGTIIDQMAFRLMDGDTRETVEEKIHALEYALYPEVIEKLIKN